MARAIGIDVSRVTLRADASGEKVFYLDGKPLVCALEPTDGGPVTIIHGDAAREIAT